MIPIFYVIANFFSSIASPFIVKFIGLKVSLLLMTGAQALITIFLLFTKSLDLVICICVLLGLTGGR